MMNCRIELDVVQVKKCKICTTDLKKLAISEIFGLSRVSPNETHQKIAYSELALPLPTSHWFVGLLWGRSAIRSISYDDFQLYNS